MNERNNRVKLFCFRFDVDTYLGAKEGVPNLVSLAEDLGVQFTFFFNMGRSVSYTKYLFSSKEKSSEKSSEKISVYKKLGLKEYLRTALMNPFVGLSFLDVIKRTNSFGHEVGLHGGRNHAVWMKEAHKWSAQEFENEIEWGLSALKKAGVNRIYSFASPGWKNNKNIYDVLAKKGIFILADLHGFDAENISFATDCGRVINVPTKFSGEPGGVGYIENLRARGFSDSAVLNDFEERLFTVNEFAMLYDHPCFAGIKEIGLLKKMILLVKEKGFSVLPLSLALSEIRKNK